MGGVGLGGVEGIIFDLDDTLYDYAEWLSPALRAAAPSLGLDGLRVLSLVEKHIAIQGRPDDGIYNFVLLACGQSDSAKNIAAMHHACLEYRPAIGELQPFPGIPEALTDLGRRYKLGLLLLGEHGSDESKLTSLGLRPFFPHIACLGCTGQDLRWPDSRPLHAIRAEMGLSNEQVLFVSDNPYRDFTVPNRIGMQTCRVLTGRYRDCVCPSADHEAHYTITSVARLPELMAGARAGTLKIVESLDFLKKSSKAAS